MADLPIIPRYPSVAHALAYLMARRAVERQLLSQGVRYFSIPGRYTEICERARDYLAEHQELLAQAVEIAMRNPKLLKMAEVEERERECELRKSARNGVVENPTGRSVYITDNANRGTEKTHGLSIAGARTTRRNIHETSITA